MVPKQVHFVRYLKGQLPAYLHLSLHWGTGEFLFLIHCLFQKQPINILVLVTLEIEGFLWLEMTQCSSK